MTKLTNEELRQRARVFWNTKVSSEGNPIASANAEQEIIAMLGKFAAERMAEGAAGEASPRERELKHHEIPVLVSQFITPERWNAMSISEQRDWAMNVIVDEMLEKKRESGSASTAGPRPELEDVALKIHEAINERSRQLAESMPYSTYEPPSKEFSDNVQADILGILSQFFAAMGWTIPGSASTAGPRPRCPKCGSRVCDPYKSTETGMWTQRCIACEWFDSWAGFAAAPAESTKESPRCAMKLCGGWESHPIHHNKAFGNFHPFLPPKPVRDEFCTCDEPKEGGRIAGMCANCGLEISDLTVANPASACWKAAYTAGAEAEKANRIGWQNRAADAEQKLYRSETPAPEDVQLDVEAIATEIVQDVFPSMDRECAVQYIKQAVAILLRRVSGKGAQRCPTCQKTIWHPGLQWSMPVPYYCECPAPVPATPRIKWDTPDKVAWLIINRIIDQSGWPTATPEARDKAHDIVQQEIETFAATPASTGETNGWVKVTGKEYGNLLAIWQTAVMLFSGPPDELPDVERMRHRMHESAPTSVPQAEPPK